MDSFIEDAVADLKAQIGDKQVILGLSGGVDSSVAAALLSRAIGKQLTCVFVDQGLMRKNEGNFVEETFTNLFDMNFVRVNCAEQFYDKLKGIVDPEEKRTIIGEEFSKSFGMKSRIWQMEMPFLPRVQSIPIESKAEKVLPVTRLIAQ